MVAAELTLAYPLAIAVPLFLVTLVTISKVRDWQVQVTRVRFNHDNPIADELDEDADANAQAEAAEDDETEAEEADAEAAGAADEEDEPDEESAEAEADVSADDAEDNTHTITGQDTPGGIRGMIMRQVYPFYYRR